MRLKTNATNLHPNNEFEQCLIDYLEANASDALVEKMNKCEVGIGACASYIRDQARKMAKDGCAAVEDKVVFGWAKHFFEEGGKVKAGTKTTDYSKPKSGELKAAREKAAKQENKPNPEPKNEKPKKEKNNEIEGQMSLFDILG